eukprot:737528-Amphidinium_carterae.1
MKTKHGWSSQQCLRAATNWAPEVFAHVDDSNIYRWKAVPAKHGGRKKKLLSHASAEFLACLAHPHTKRWVPHCRQEPFEGSR